MTMRRMTENASQDSYTHAETYAELSKRYAHVLMKARDFVVKKKTAKSGGSASSVRKATLRQEEADCPQCGLKFRGENHNTEHIHPKSLGGGASDKANRIQMCKMCNNARNSTMTAFIGTPPYSRDYPANWKRIEAFLLWSELTIDDGLDAGARIPEVHELFLEARFAGQRPEWARPSRAFGRFATWQDGSEPNYPHNAPATISEFSRSTPIEGAGSSGERVRSGLKPSTLTLRSLLARKARNFFDALFDYPSNNPASQPERAVSEQPERAVPEQPEPSNSADAEPSDKRPLDVQAILDEWRSIIQLRSESNNGQIMLGEIWDLVARKKEEHGLAWRAFEREFGLTRASMPVKATQLLQSMDFIFSFQKTDEGYVVVFNREEE